jgi:uncharacterized membrane protein
VAESRERGWERLLVRWTEAGVLDGESAARIRAFELERRGPARLRWPVLIALAFGALTLGAGVLLFVSAHWDALSPQARFALVVLLVAVFHVAGAATERRFPGMATALHAVGTVALGAGIFLAGQIFNLDGHWPGGLLLWAIGAALAWALLPSWPQMALTAILAPAWLSSEWYVATLERWSSSGYLVMACGIFLMALAYFTALSQAQDGDHGLLRRTLAWLGGIWLLPASVILAFGSDVGREAETLSVGLRAMGWAVALGLPLAVAIALRRGAAWPNALATLWVVVLVNLSPVAGDASVYAWWAVGATALAVWGVSESRNERINLGSAIFAATVMAFYFSHVMDKLGRSASLIGLGLLFLAGGSAIERLRRRLVRQARGGRSHEPRVPSHEPRVPSHEPRVPSHE